ncbi:MAG TPA: cytochrome c peroxidase [Candidatus Angelobacter sp.]
MSFQDKLKKPVGLLCTITLFSATYASALSGGNGGGQDGSGAGMTIGKGNNGQGGGNLNSSGNQKGKLSSGGNTGSGNGGANSGGGNSGGGNSGGGNGGATGGGSNSGSGNGGANSGGGNSGGGNSGGGNSGSGNSGGNGGANSGGGNGGITVGGGNGGTGSGRPSGGGENGGSGKGGSGGGSGKGGGNANVGGHDGRGLGSLKTATIPGPTAAELANLITDKKAAIALGKAFFWEMQFGSDGKTACASCHFNAGADSRTGNQIDPGQRRVDANGFPAPDSNTFHAGFGPNHALAMNDFPLHTTASDNNNIVGSQGVLRNNFNDVILGQGAEDETSIVDPVWSISDGNDGTLNVRRSTPRNAPSVINAVFNSRNFWDGRAQSIFNGVDPFGAGDPAARLLQTDPNNLNATVEVALRLSNSSLASQAVGPPGSDIEMSATGRPFVKIGKKMLTLTPLGLQQVATDDSVLGSLSAMPNNGLTSNYISMIQAAFQPKWWNSNVVVDASSNYLHNGTPANTNEYSQMEYNFSMFWGVAIQMYESTLVSDNSRFDQFVDGNSNALTSIEQTGLDRFEGKGGCINCHNGVEFTDASVSNIVAKGTVVEQLSGGRWHDIGFHNIGLRPTDDDMGIAASDPSGLASLSVAQLASLGQVSGTPVPAGAPVAVVGAVKTPSLRNVELTAPYFLNGGQATLAQLVDFYSRGGDFRTVDQDPKLQPVSFSADDKAAVVAFLKSLTDERVRNQSAPFDHPSLLVPNGAIVTDGVMTEQMITIPATGASGGAAMTKFCDSLVGASSATCQ